VSDGAVESVGVFLLIRVFGVYPRNVLGSFIQLFGLFSLIGREKNC